MRAHQDSEKAFRQERENQFIDQSVDWRLVFDTRTPHSPQNYDEIECVLATLAEGLDRHQDISIIATWCAKKLEDMRANCPDNEVPSSTAGQTDCYPQEK
jgi:hypothetical protein